jgi:small subunit ribosomal protein S6
MRNYEFMFIIVPEATDEEKLATIEIVKNGLKEVGVADIIVEKMGERKLAYLIDKKATGYYVLFKFSGETYNFKEFEIKMNMNEKLMRYILVKK